jgi:formylglycine-generating enzyme required for sulfatase activity
VVCVSWDDAQDYVRWLSKKAGLKYRLLTEVEWEYISSGEANYKVKHPFTSPVGSNKPNGFGVFDMTGNVAEWVDDCFREKLTPHGTVKTSEPPMLCARLYRGQSWENESKLENQPYRDGTVPYERMESLGFRIGLTLE